MSEASKIPTSVEFVDVSKGDKGLELTNIEWLLDHHVTKEQERRQMIDALDINPGDTVLDLGCGPGLWTAMLADKVKPDGKVIGLDFDPSLVKFAQEKISIEYKDIIEFKEADFHKIPFDANKFDFVFFGNCFAYVTEIEKVIEEMKRVTKEGGKVAAKDFDGAVFIVHPIEPHLTMKILSAAAQSMQETPPDPYFDNFVGRKLHGLFLKAEFRNISTTSHIIQKLSPLIPEAKRYITGNAEWHAKIGSAYLSEDDIQKWKNHFDPKSDTYVLDSEEFYFCMLEILTIGIV